MATLIVKLLITFYFFQRLDSRWHYAERRPLLACFLDFTCSWIPGKVIGKTQRNTFLQ